MKQKTMQAPNLQQIYDQKNQYLQHKRKLHQIYQDRKSQLGHDTHRLRDIDGIKEIKVKSFVNNYNMRSQSITRQNIKLLDRLEKVKPSLSHKSIKEPKHGFSQIIKPIQKKRMFETQKQNYRICNRMKSMESSLSQKSMMKDYQKSQRIKNRLMKYTKANDRIELKSQRSFRDSHSRISDLNCEKSISKAKPTQRKSTVSYYKRDQITRNKVDISTNTLAKIKAKNQRPITSFQTGNKYGSFFPTQPNKKRFNYARNTKNKR